MRAGFHSTCSPSAEKAQLAGQLLGIDMLSGDRIAPNDEEQADTRCHALAARSLEHFALVRELPVDARNQGPH